MTTPGISPLRETGTVVLLTGTMDKEEEKEEEEEEEEKEEEKGERDFRETSVLR